MTGPGPKKVETAAADAFLSALDGKTMHQALTALEAESKGWSRPLAREVRARVILHYAKKGGRS